MMLYSRQSWIVLGLLLFLCGLSCSRKKVPEFDNEILLAKVGNRVITVNEFKLSYETSLASLRRGVSPKRTYLNYMIKELLLANEGYKQGMHKNHYVRSRIKRRREQNLLEAFYKAHVHNQVKIPEDVVQDATQKATVKFRLLVWPLPSLEQANNAYVEAKKTSLEDYVGKELAKQEVPLAEKRFFETDWMDYLDMRPEMFEKIKDLKLRTPSEPIPFGGAYAIFEILDLELHGISTEELTHGIRRKKMQLRLKNIEANRIARALLDSLLTPMDVRTKGEIFNLFAPALYKWIQEGLPEQGTLIKAIEAVQDTSKEYLRTINSLMNKTLLTYRKGRYTVKDYLYHLNYYRKALKKSKSLDDFKNRLVIEIGTMVKNDVFIRIAKNEGFQDSTQIVNDLRIWEQKWTYDIYREWLLKNVTITQDEKMDYFKHHWRKLNLGKIDTTNFLKYEKEVTGALRYEKHKLMLENELAKLEKRYPIWINDAVLDTLKVDESQKSLQTSFFLRKNFTGEAFVPSADIKWIGY